MMGYMLIIPSFDIMLGYTHLFSLLLKLTRFYFTFPHSFDEIFKGDPTNFQCHFVGLELLLFP